ncbi:MAG: hypothetical protein CL908_12050 [Deltaproteobacteria bacterium]|jgi:hypothetical protein|nr:hypothetical protein [Deltaproteobacteria bacterium]
MYDSTHSRASRHPTLILSIAAAFMACDDGPPPGPPIAPAPEWTSERSIEALEQESRLTALDLADPGALEIHLAFGASADLDLYVTGPLEETVYFANTPSSIGGELREDWRCEHAGAGVETIRFPAPITPGRYRVGVDYPYSCDKAKQPAAFALRVLERAGGAEKRGLAAYRVFEPVVLDFEIVIATEGSIEIDTQRDEQTPARGREER